MINLKSHASRLLFTTTRIVGQHSDGSESVGTAFFFAFKIDEQTHLPVLITNKHVVKNASRGIFFVHEALKESDGQVKPSTNSFGFALSDFEKGWVNHPEEDIDLCAMPFGSLRQQALAQGKEIFYVSLDESIIPTQEQLESLSALEEIVMVGYPISIWDEVNNFPVLRHGITASHAATNFNGKPIGVVDIAAFPGSSGSPLFILNEGAYQTPTGFSIGSRLLFLGILYAGPQHRADGSITVVDIPTKQSSIATTMIPAHLGYYIKSAELHKLKEHMFSTMNIKAES